ncbi:MAG: preprotein translocase subunit SecY [Pseudomonadota bacterium]
MANKPSGFSELKARLFFVLGALFVYRIGSHIPVPLDMFNMFSGGALMRLSLFALGIMPYISASIIMQLMTVVIPTMEQLKKEGESGRRKVFLLRCRIKLQVVCQLY